MKRIIVPVKECRTVRRKGGRGKDRKVLVREVLAGIVDEQQSLYGFTVAEELFVRLERPISHCR